MAHAGQVLPDLMTAARVRCTVDLRRGVT
jgi:hypothetical protein